jgi:phage shock protein A
MIEKNESPENEKRPDDLSGMEPDAAKEYVLGHVSVLKLTEKEIASLAEALAKWEGRIRLARSRDAGDLAAEAEKEVRRIGEKKAALENEAAGLRAQIETMRRRLPGLAARRRSVDPDLLEQELLMAAGRMPGDEQKAAADRAFEGLEKEKAADDALEALKAKMGTIRGEAPAGVKRDNTPSA